MAGVVRVRYSKFDGRAHRDYPARRLADDEYGTWLGVTAGTTSIYHGRPSVERIPFVLLVPRDRWFTAMFNPPPRTSEIYCDIAAPARWDGATGVRLIDLDLDVVRRRHTGLVELLDEDEFAEHTHSFGYPPEVVAAAEAEAAQLRSALSGRQPPFVTEHYRRFLDQVTAGPGESPWEPAREGTVG